MERSALYPGTFDCVTEGHLDIIEAGLKLFDTVIVGVLINPTKTPMFCLEDRITFIGDSIRDRGLDINRVYIDSSDKMTVDFASECTNTIALLRGLRLSGDYEYELTLAFNNHRLNSDIQTVLIPPKQEHMHISSTVVRQLINFNQLERVREYVTPTVWKKIVMMNQSE